VDNAATHLFFRGDCIKLFPDDLRVRVTTAVVIAACVAAAFQLGPRLDGFWPGGLTIILASIAGIVIGPLVGRLLFRPSPPK